MPVISDTLLDVPVTAKHAVLLPGVTVAKLVPPKTLRTAATRRAPGCAALTQLIGAIDAMPAGSAGGVIVTVALYDPM